MARKNQNITSPPTGRATLYVFRNWDQSPRVNGRLELRPQYYDMYRTSSVISRSSNANAGYGLPYAKDATAIGQVQAGWYLPNRDSSWFDSSNWSRMHTICYGKFMGKMKSDRASLGVSFASWRQSAEMIRGRSQKIGDFFFKKPPPKVPWTTRSRRDFAQARASDILEGEFGWVPLVQDIHDAMAVMASGVPPSWVRATHREQIRRRARSGSAASYFEDRICEGVAWVTYSSQVRVTNPNLWLLNQLGLINPAVVAWDLVPWSFVVNMFTNIPQILGSFTDLMGVELVNPSATMGRNVKIVHRFTAGTSPNYRGWDENESQVQNKFRDLGLFPRPKLILRAPPLSLETAVIAASLMVQRVKKFNRIAEAAWKGRRSESW